MPFIDLTIPITQDLKINAENATHEQGFSSLQEIVRVFLTKLAANKVEVTLESIILSDEKRYLSMTENFDEDKNVYTAQSIGQLRTISIGKKIWKTDIRYERDMLR